MESAKQLKLVALAVLAAALVLPLSHASAQDDAWRTWAPESEFSGARVHIDNDLFAGRELPPIARFFLKRVIVRRPDARDVAVIRRDRGNDLRLSKIDESHVTGLDAVFLETTTNGVIAGRVCRQQNLLALQHFWIGFKGIEFAAGDHHHIGFGFVVGDADGQKAGSCGPENSGHRTRAADVPGFRLCCGDLRRSTSIRRWESATNSGRVCGAGATAVA